MPASTFLPAAAAKASRANACHGAQRIGDFVNKLRRWITMRFAKKRALLSVRQNKFLARTRNGNVG